MLFDQITLFKPKTAIKQPTTKVFKPRLAQRILAEKPVDPNLDLNAPRFEVRGFQRVVDLLM